MKQEGGGRTLAWLATGAAVLAAGAFLGSATSRRRDRGPYAGRDRGPELPEGLADRPLAREAWADALAAGRKVDELQQTVAGLTSRVAGLETGGAGRVEAVWQRVLRIEQRLEEVRTGQGEAAAAEAGERILPRVAALETRVEEHGAAILELRAHAAQTEANLQKMIAAVEKLTDQISRALPPAAPLRIEPRKETEAAGETGAEKGGPSRWRSAALIGAISLGLAGSYATIRTPRPPESVAAAAPAPATDRLLDTAVTSLTALAERDSENPVWKLEAGRLNHIKGDTVQAERWYRAALAEDPHDARALDALADLLTERVRRGHALQREIPDVKTQ